MKYYHWIVLAALALFFLGRGVVPALEGVNTDFPNYYTSARLVVGGLDVSRLYDDDWFQEQIRQYGMDQMGKFSPFPPVTALVMIPLTFLSPANALRVWTFLDLAMLAYAVLLVNRIAAKPWYWGTALVLFSGHALANNFKFGQIYLGLTLLMLIGYLSWIQGKSTRSGIAFGIGAAVKYFPIIVLIEFAQRRQWKLMAWFLVTVGLITLLGVTIIGFDVHVQFLQTVLGRHLSGDIQDPFSPTFQSWNSLFRRIFIYDPIRNPTPLVNSALGYGMALASVYISTVLFLAAGLIQARRKSESFADSVQFALVCIGGLLLLPASATYHFLLLVPPLAILLKGTPWTFAQKSLAVLYASIGFLPYHSLEALAGKTHLFLLAYPRLILMIGVFAASLAIARQGPETKTRVVPA